MCGGKSQDMIGIDGASGALTGKVIDLTKKKYPVTPSFAEKYRRWYNCNIVPPKGKMVLNKNQNQTISKRYVGSLIIVTLGKLLRRKLVLDVRSRYTILTYATHDINI